jgi:1,4-dihydroxy-6-naphthoate synthase
MLVRIGHTPTPDDAFMLWALASGAVGLPGVDFELVAEQIDVLNQRATAAELEITALSVHVYPPVQESYVLLPHGAAMTSGSGPLVISRTPLSCERLRKVEIAVPSDRTTSFLVLRMCLESDFRFRVLPAGEILEEVRSGRVEAGLVVEESQLLYERQGLSRSLDLGEWWLLETGLPLPLTVIAARRDLGDRLPELSNAIRESIVAAFASRRRATAHAMRFGRSSDAEITARFVDMYVNEHSFDFGAEGREAIAELLRRAQLVGAFEQPVKIEFVDRG